MTLVLTELLAADRRLDVPPLGATGREDLGGDALDPVEGDCSRGPPCLLGEACSVGDEWSMKGLSSRGEEAEATLLLEAGTDVATVLPTT